MARELKDSGIEWIGQIPKEWKIVPFKAYFTTGKGLSFTKADLTPQGHAVVSYGQVHSKVNTGTRLDDTLLRYIPDSITENGDASRMNKGDFIFADTSEDLEGCGNCVYVDRNMELYAGYHSVTAKPKVQYDNKFFAYYFQTPCWRSQIRSRVTGIKVYSISQSIINKTYIFVPPLSIQQKIADYLDKVCDEIDEMVALQETMIEELKAYKQSVITEAVTKGLNPNVPMRNSGIDWIGEIPKHWEVIKMRRCVDSIGDVDHYMPDSIETGIPYIMTRDLADRTSMINKNQCKQISYEDFANLSRKISIEKNDVIFARYASIGNVCFVDTDEEMIVSYSCVIIKPLPILSGLYLFYYLKSKTFEEEVLQFVNTNIQGNVGIDSLYKTKMMMPPLTEQQQIASYLDTKCSEIDSLITLKQTKIEELKEYKKSVIYEYVTGKKEVN